MNINEIYRLYDVNDSNGRTFDYLLVNDKPIISPERINYIEVAPDNIWVIEPNGTILGDTIFYECKGISKYREIYLKRVTEDMITLFKKDGMTDQLICNPSFKPPYTTYREAMEENTQSKEAPVETDESTKSEKSIDLLKEKMDTEGTMNVEDYLAGKSKS